MSVTQPSLDLAARIVQSLRERGWLIATAESLTGGLISSTLTQIPGASQAVSAGLVVYSTAAKSAVLGIDAAEIAAHGVYSEWTARAMAEAAAHITGAQVSVACTGVAGPGADEAIPPGHVWWAVRTPAQTQVWHEAIAGDRDAVRAGTVARALSCVAQMLEAS